jgi:hypothetical protein
MKDVEFLRLVPMRHNVPLGLLDGREGFRYESKEIVIPMYRPIIEFHEKANDTLARPKKSILASSKCQSQESRIPICEMAA